MNNPTLAELADKIPMLVKEGIKGLSDDDRLGLVIALVEDGRMTFSELKARYDLNPSTLSSHLNALQKGNLVRNYFEKGAGRAYSYYEATALPEAVLSALFTAAHKTKAAGGHPQPPEGMYSSTAQDEWQYQLNLQALVQTESQEQSSVQSTTRRPAITANDNSAGKEMRPVTTSLGWTEGYAAFPGRTTV